MNPAQQQAQSLLQAYQEQMNQLQRIIDPGKEPAPAQAQSPDLIEVQDRVTQEQSELLNALFKQFVADQSRDGARELVSGLSKFGRFAQSEFDKMRPKA